MTSIDQGVSLTLDQRKEQNFRNYFFYIEALFYFFQGVYTAGIQVYVAYYTTQVFKLDYATIASINAAIGIPLYLKMFTGLLSDRVPVGKFGRRKPYLFLGGILFIPAFIGIATIKTYSNIWLVSLIACFACFVIVDGTADALTVDVTPDEYTGKMQGFANGGRYLGMAVGIILASVLSKSIGWNTVIAILAIAAVGQAFVALLFKEVPEAGEKGTLIPIKSALKIGLGNKGAWMGLVFAVCFMGSMGLANMVGPVVMTETNEAVYGMANMAHYIGIAVSAFVAGQLITKMGGFTNRNIWIMFIATWVLISPLLLMDGRWDNTALVIFAHVTMGIARGIVTLITYAILMRLCSEAIEGFMFSIFTSAMNLGTGAIAPKVIAYFGETVGIGMIPALFTMMPLMLIGVLMIPGINRSVEQRIALQK